jgi:hypothetical protein
VEFDIVKKVLDTVDSTPTEVVGHGDVGTAVDEFLRQERADKSRTASYKN